MNNESRPHFKPGAVKYTKGYGRRVFFSRLVNFVIISISIMAMAMTIFVYVVEPVRTETGFTQADRIRNRLPKIGEKIVVVKEDSYNMFTPLVRATTVQDVYEAEIVAGPYGELKQSTDNLVVVYANQTTPVNLQENLEDLDDQYLDEEYVVREIDGENYTGAPDEIVDLNDILGNVQKDVSVR